MDLAGLSFVERQEEWLRRKQTTLRAKTHEVERAVKNAATFNPNLAISQSSLRPAQVHNPWCFGNRSGASSIVDSTQTRHEWEDIPGRGGVEVPEFDTTFLHR